MNKRVLTALSAIGFIPLLFKLPYMLRAWKISPLDRGEWGFLVAFLVMLWCGRRIVTARRETPPDWRALLPGIAAVAGIVVGYGAQVHAIGILAAIGFSWSVVWLLWGWRSALTLLPAYGMLALSGTSTRYWLGYFAGPLHLDGLTVKLILAAFLAGWWGIMLRKEWRIAGSTLLFYAVAVGMLLMIWQAGLFQKTGAPFLPQFSITANPDYLGRELVPTENDLRFFGDCEIRKYFFASDTGSVNVLAIKAGSNIHKIHPASHCLRSGGWTINQEQLKEVTIGNRRFEVTEIEAAMPEITMIVWVWYSNPAFSTGSFLGFRRNWSPRVPWYIYQISTPLHLSLGEAQRQLAEFLQETPVAPAPPAQ